MNRAALESLKAEAARLREDNERLESRGKQLEKEIQQIKAQSVQKDAEQIIKQNSVEIGFINFVGVQLQEQMQHIFLRAMADQIQKKKAKTVTFLMDQAGYCVTTSSEDAQKKGVAANELLKVAIGIAGGEGGGRSGMAQGRIKEPSKFFEIREQLRHYIQERST